MFANAGPKGKLSAAFNIFELIYHSTVRGVRQGHRNAVVAVLTAMLQALMLVAVFYIMFSVLGLRDSAVRGDFLLYVMSGIFLFITHNKAIGAVFGSEGPNSPMMNHAPMNTIISISSSALGALYIQFLALVCALFIYHIVVTPVVIEKPVAALAMFLAAWISGVGVGLVFLGLKPWIPGLASILQSFYTRANMVTSGKMFLANMMPGYMIAWFDWNPLFHAIDQARGYTFINYNPHFSDPMYPIKATLALVMIGLMLEFSARKNVSISWTAGK